MYDLSLSVTDFGTMAFVFVPVLLLLFFVLSFLLFYRRCKPNQLLVVYGKTGGGRSAKVVHGGAAFVLPVVQDYEYMSLQPIDYEVDLKDALSANNIRLDIPTSCTVAIGTSPELSSIASERLLGLSQVEVKEAAQNITIGQLRAAVATLTIEQINQDRESFLEKVNTNIADELAKLGLEVININVKDISDKMGYIEAIGRKAAETVVQRANVDVAEQQKLGAIGTQKAEREKDTQVAIESAESEKAISRTVAEKEIFVAQRQSEQIQGENETKKAIALSEAELKIAEASARKDAEVAEQIAEKEIQERRKETELARQRAHEVVAETIEAEKKIEEAKGEAESIQIVAKAEAEALLTKYEAEAEGMRKVMKAKAEGYHDLVRSAGDSDALAKLQVIEKLEEVVRLQTEAIAKMKIDNLTVWDQGSENGQAGLKSFMKDFLTMGAPMHEMASNVGIELPSFMGKQAELKAETTVDMKQEEA
ncbi:Inner membrane protein YqiK [Vibrio aerogenes CECT 7868]|uniref:Inner membrane protein YqiK n=1 Tax=Vibrio aerogenes CECT 7868 TaxID=1216006 RepID=A0A1M6BIM2_9VIBR|nr:flotillin family protein [Vibrio aerogenes]SHI48555.1 Inner membrane protein YqiK [Vibrio aerogenes CECT 7868]